MTIASGDHLGRIASDLEAASLENLEAFETTGSGGISQERCESCDRPLPIDAYGTWFGSPSRTDVRIAYSVCGCRYE